MLVCQPSEWDVRLISAVQYLTVQFGIGLIRVEFNIGLIGVELRIGLIGGILGLMGHRCTSSPPHRAQAAIQPVMDLGRTLFCNRDHQSALL